VLERDGRPYGLAGDAGGRECALLREGDAIVFEAGRARWSLREVWIEHRDEGGRVRLRVMRGAEEQHRMLYRRRGPTLGQRLTDLADFTAYEPWTWEDSDFGLLVFHVASQTGPIKYRHALVEEDWQSREPPGDWLENFEVDDRGVSRRLRDPALRPAEHVLWDDLAEIRAKFEVAGVWAEKSLLVLGGAASQCVVPVRGEGGLPPGLLAALERLPGFDERARRAVGDAVAYAESDRWPGPVERRTRAERPVWRRPVA
jgi:hypothetical protein